MRKLISTLAFIFLLPIGAQNAIAGAFADDLGRCLVRSATDADRSLLVRWMFMVMAVHPSVRDLTQISDERRAEAAKGAAALFQTLVTKSCNVEAKLAMKNEDLATFESSFSVLGQTASRELFTEPGVARALAGLAQNVDIPAIEAALQ